MAVCLSFTVLVYMQPLQRETAEENEIDRERERGENENQKQARELCIFILGLAWIGFYATVRIKMYLTGANSSAHSLLRFHTNTHTQTQTVRERETSVSI